MNWVRIGFTKINKFWFSKKHILIVYLLVFLWEDVVSRIIDISKETGMEMGIGEAAILLLTDSNYCLVFFILYIVLLYDFPMGGKWEQNIVYRVGKTSWHIGNILYTTLIAILFIGEIVCMTSILSSMHGTEIFDWSDFTTDLYYQFPEVFGRNAQLFIGTEVVAQSSPLEALFCSVSLNILLMIALGQIIFYFFLIDKKMLGVIVSTAIVMLGWILNILDLNIKWLFPFSHVLFGEHYTNILSMANCPLWVSYSYFVLLNFALYFMVKRELKRSTVW